MTKENKKRLTELYLKDNKAKYPSFPDHARPIRKYSEKGANALTKCVIDWINFSGFQAERINTMGRRVDKTEVSTDVLGRKRMIGSVEWQKGTGQKGSADISSIIRSKKGVVIPWKIEIKYGKDRQSEYQKEYEEKINKVGGVYSIVKNFDSFVEIYDGLVND